MHDKTRDKYSINKEAKENRIEFKINNNTICTDNDIKSAKIKYTIEKWKAKPLHGQFYRSVIDKENIDTNYSFRWLKKQAISPSLEASIFSLQDQAIITRQHERDVLKRAVDGKCFVVSKTRPHNTLWRAASSWLAPITPRDTITWCSTCTGPSSKNTTWKQPAYDGKNSSLNLKSKKMIQPK